MPDRAQRAGVALERRRGHVIKHQGAVGQMPGGQGVFDGVLDAQHPVHRRIEVVLIGTRDAQQLSQRAGGGVGAQPARGGQFRRRRDHRRGQHGAHQIPVARGRRVDQLSHAQLLGGAQHRGHMPVRQAAGDLKRLGQIRRCRHALERALQSVHLVFGPA